MRSALRPLLLLALCRSAGGVLSVDLVLSHYAEPLRDVLAFVQRAQAVLREAAPEEGGAVLSRIFFVTHASDQALRREFSDPDVQVPRELNWTSLRVPNYGRESYAYLTYLERHLRDSSMASHVWFTHAVPDAYLERTLWPRLPLLSRRTGMLGLGIRGGTSCGGSLDVALGPFLSAIYFDHVGSFCLPSMGWAVMYNGVFVVSSRRLRLLSPRLAKRLRKALELPNEHAIHVTDGWQPPGAKETNSSRVNPVLGYAIERMWNGARSHRSRSTPAALTRRPVFFNCTTDVLDCHADMKCEPHAAQCLDEPGD